MTQDDDVLGAVYRGGPYDGTTDDRREMTAVQDLEFDSGGVHRYELSTDTAERVDGHMRSVYKYVGPVE